MLNNMLYMLGEQGLVIIVKQAVKAMAKTDNINIKCPKLVRYQF